MNTNPNQLTSQVKLLQKIVLQSDEDFLILKRAEGEGYRSGKWDLPGGNSVWPESSVDLPDPHLMDLWREVEEETGIVVSDELATNKHLVFMGSYFEASKQLYTIIIGWRLELPENFDQTSIRLSAEHTEYRWISREVFDEFDFGFAGEEEGFIRQIVDHCYV